MGQLAVISTEIDGVEKDLYPVSIPEGIIDPSDKKALSEDLPKIKDKTYDSAGYSGLGRTYLKKNMVDGVNLLTQAMISFPDTVYIIEWDFDLNGETLEVPADCVLDFKGGSFNNGSVVFSGTKFYNPKFNNCTFSGTTNCHVFNIDDFGAISGDESFDNSVVINDLITLKNDSAKGPKTIYVPNGTYYIQNPIILYDYYYSSVQLYGESDWSVICQVTDNIPIIKHYETNKVCNLRLQYKNYQSVENTKAIAVAAHRMIYSLYENVTIKYANTGFGFLTTSQVQEDGIMNSGIPPCHVNVSARNIKIYAFSNYALDFKKELSNGDSGSVYSNVYISSDDWDGIIGIYTAVGAVRMQNTSAHFDQLNIEGSSYSSYLIDMISIGSVLTIGSLHVEGMSIKRLINTYNNCCIDIANVNITRCSFDTNYGSLIYGTIGSFLNIESIKATSCTKTATWYLVAGSSNTPYTIGSFIINEEARVTALNGSSKTLNLVYGKNGIRHTEAYQTIFDFGRPFNWVMDAGLNTNNSLYNKVCYKDKDNNLRYPDGNLAYYNEAIIRKLGDNTKIPNLSSDANNINIGFTYFNTYLNKMMIWDGKGWVTSNSDNIKIIIYRIADNVPMLITLNDWSKYKANGEKASGVVVFEGDKHVVVSLSGKNLPWSSSAIDGGGTKASTRKEAIIDWDSEANASNQLEHPECNTVDYAQGYCASYSDVNTNNVGLAAGTWMLPSCGELAMMSRNIDNINAALVLIDNAELLPKVNYISCTETSNANYVWCFHFYDSVINTGNKVDTCYVRPVSKYQ